MQIDTPQAVVFGGYGTFGRHVVRSLTRLGIPVVIAGRNADRAARFAAELGNSAQFTIADVTDQSSCATALTNAKAAVNCAGPFGRLGTALVEACLEQGVHYVDIADDRGYVNRVRSFHGDFARAELTAAYGCSSLPGISGALAMLLMRRGAARPNRARVTLFIGNNNPKGAAAIESAISLLGKQIAAPQGFVRGFRDPETVRLPPPFGRRTVYNFESPEYDLFPTLLGTGSVSVKVGFELRIVTACFAACALMGIRGTRTLAQVFAGLGNLSPRIGSSGGVVMSELFTSDNRVHRATLWSRTQGQEMAALPCGLVVRALCSGEITPRGSVAAYEAIDPESLIAQLVEHGHEFNVELNQELQ